MLPVTASGLLLSMSWAWLSMSLKEKYSHQGWHSCQDRKSPVPNSCAMASGPDGRLAYDSMKLAEREPGLESARMATL